MNGTTFPTLTLVDLGGAGDTQSLKDADKQLIEVRDYLFHSDETVSPENLATLRQFLEVIHKQLLSVMAAYGADEQDGTAGAIPSSGLPAAVQGIRESGAAAREALLAVRLAVRTTKVPAEDYDRLRTELSQPKNKRDTMRVLLESQQEIEGSISTLASRLRAFVTVVSEMGNGGLGPAVAGSAQRRPSRRQVMDGRPHYIPWQSPDIGTAS